MAPVEVSPSITWDDGDLAYGVAVAGNSFIQDGRVDEGVVHEGIWDGFERANCIADTARWAFGQAKLGGSPGNWGILERIRAYSLENRGRETRANSI